MLLSNTLFNGSERICLRKKRKSSSFISRNDGTSNSSLSRTKGSKNMLKEVRHKSNGDTCYSFVSMLVLHWKRNKSLDLSLKHINLKTWCGFTNLETNKQWWSGLCPEYTAFQKKWTSTRVIETKSSFLHRVNVLWGDTQGPHTYSAHFTQLGEHHNYGGIVFPEHPPEVFSGLCQGPLGSDVGFLLSELQRMKRMC